MPVPRILLVGAGSMGLLHARVISQSASADLAAIVDPRPDVGQDAADRFGTRWTAQLPDDLSSFDAVVVAAATEAHRDLALQVLDSGLPLLLEKPVTGDLVSTVEVLTASQQKGVPLMCGLLERFNAGVLTALAMTDDPVYVTATRHSPYVPRIRTGVSWDLLVHDVDLASRFLGGVPTNISGQLGFFRPDSAPEAEDVAEATIQFTGGRLAQISASRVGQHKIRTMAVHDLDKMIEIDLLRRDVTVYRHVADRPQIDVEELGYRHRTVIEIPELVSVTEPLVAQLDHFIALVRGSVDADAERASILPSHQIVDAVSRLRPV